MIYQCLTEIVEGRFYQKVDTAVDNKGKHYTILVRHTHTKKVLLVSIAMVRFIDNRKGYRSHFLSMLCVKSKNCSNALSFRITVSTGVISAKSDRLIF